MRNHKDNVFKKSMILEGYADSEYLKFVNLIQRDYDLISYIISEYEDGSIQDFNLNYLISPIASKYYTPSNTRDISLKDLLVNKINGESNEFYIRRRLLLMEKYMVSLDLKDRKKIDIIESFKKIFIDLNVDYVESLDYFKNTITPAESILIDHKGITNVQFKKMKVENSFIRNNY